MITPAYCHQMARYNAWQNQLLAVSLGELSDQDLRADRGAFFGSLFRTVNHLLWGDTLWISRFDDGVGPAESDLSKTDTTDTTSSLIQWQAERQSTDKRFVDWAEQVSQEDLEGDLTWFSGSIQRDISKPKALCIVQMFNHQTHHRGQVHAMLGAANAPMYVTDLPFMPE